MSKLLQLIYVSAAKHLMDEVELAELLERCRRANAIHNITGMLLYRDGDFMQVIEGPAHAINQLEQNLESDTSHHRMTVLVKEPINTREFPKWTMGYTTVTPSQIEGFTDFFNCKKATDSIRAGKAKQILESFKIVLEKPRFG